MTLQDDPIERIIIGLSPFLGRSMAQSSVKGHIVKLSLSAPYTRGDLDRLLAALAPGVNVFLGRVKGQAVMTGLRKNLGFEA